MPRTLLASLVLLCLSQAAAAHFVFILPDAPPARTAKVVFSDRLQPDPRVEIDRIGSTKLYAADGKSAPAAVDWQRPGDKPYFVAEAPAGARFLGGTTDYGVFQRGESPAFRLVYHPKAAFGELPAEAAPAFAGKVLLEIAPYAAGGKLHFQVFLDGKPLPKAEVDVYLPGGEERAKNVTAGGDGATEGFDMGEEGVYAARVTHKQAGEGIHDGKPYEETRHYATVTVRVAKE